MSRYFVNLAPKGWTELFDNCDTIDLVEPGIWFSKANTSDQFVTVRHKNQSYKVHISQLQSM